MSKEFDKKWFGKVDNLGVLHLEDNINFKQQLQILKEKDIELVVRPKRKMRSNSENKYYWSVICTVLGNHLGYEATEMNDTLKYKFLRKEIDKERQLVKVGSTAELSTVEFEELMTKIRRWASIDLNVYIPLPNEVDY